MGMKTKLVNAGFSAGKKAAGRVAKGADKGLAKKAHKTRVKSLKNASKPGKQKGLPAAGKTSKANGFGNAVPAVSKEGRATAQRPAGPARVAVAKSKSKAGKAAKPAKIGFGATSSGRATVKQVTSNTGSKRMKAGAVAGSANSTTKAVMATRVKNGKSAIPRPGKKSAVGGVVGAGGYTTYKRKTKSGKVVTVRRKG